MWGPCVYIFFALADSFLLRGVTTKNEYTNCNRKYTEQLESSGITEDAGALDANFPKFYDSLHAGVVCDSCEMGVRNSN